MHILRRKERTLPAVRDGRDRRYTTGSDIWQRSTGPAPDPLSDSLDEPDRIFAFRRIVRAVLDLARRLRPATAGNSAIRVSRPNAMPMMPSPPGRIRAARTWEGFFAADESYMRMRAVRTRSHPMVRARMPGRLHTPWKRGPRGDEPRRTKERFVPRRGPHANESGVYYANVNTILYKLYKFRGQKETEKGKRNGLLPTLQRRGRK